jgi:hypothetical protein
MSSWMLKDVGQSHLSSVIVIFAVIVGLIMATLGQQQIVVNPDFRDGLLGWLGYRYS